MKFDPAKQIGKIIGEPGERCIELSKEEKKAVLERVSEWNERGTGHLKFKLLKWSLIRNYVHGYDWSDQKGTPIIASQRIMGGLGLSATGNVDEEVYVNNVVMRIHMSNVQRFGRYMPNIDVEPNDTSRENKLGARNTKIFLNDLLDKTKFKSRVKRKADRLICMYGSSWTKVSVDSKPYEEVSKPILDNFGKISGFEEDGDGCGSIWLDAVAPKNIVIPPFVTDPTEMDWLIENNVRTTDYIYRRYGVLVKPEKLSLDDTKWFRMQRDQGRESASGTTVPDNLAWLKEGFIRRCEEFPLGAHIIWVGTKENGIIIKSTTMDDFFPDIPYFKSEFIYDDEDIDGETPYWFMIPMQDALNRVEADIRRHCIMMTKPKWQQHTETTLMDPDGITNETAQVLRWTGSFAPGIIAAAELPKTVFQWRDMVMGELMSLGAAHDIVRPSNPRSGTAIAYEQEQDDTTLAPTIESMGQMYEQAFTLAAKLKSQYITAKRAYSMKTPKGLIVSEAFSGDELRGNFRVRVNMQSGLPSNKIARQQLVVQLAAQKIIKPSQAQRFFEFGEADEALQNELIAYERAQKLVEALEGGLPYAAMPSMPFDNHEIMVDVLKTTMQERWEAWDQPTKIEFMAAYQAHIQAMLPPPGMMPMAAPGGPNSTPGQNAPLMPPGVANSGQEPGQQPPRGQGGMSLYEIPGMGDENIPPPEAEGAPA